MREKWHVVGIRKFDYESKKTGRSYKACNLYVQTERKGVDGLVCMEIFIPAELVPDSIVVGVDCYLFYNRFGKCDTVVKA